MNNKNAVVKKIKLIAKDVYKSLGSGFSEYVYDQALQVGLRLAGIKYENQKVVELLYKGHSVGEGYPDLVVHAGKQRLVVELKAVGGEMGAAEIQQIKNYMHLLNISFGLLINFQQPERREGQTKLEIKEITIEQDA